MNQSRSVDLEQISIRDRLKGLMDSMRTGKLANLARNIPRGVCASGIAGVGVLTGLFVVSIAISNVVVHQGYETFAFAKPTATHRFIRQHEVAKFGSRVSSAFGINGEVATEFADWILEASERQQITPELLASLVVTESSFRKNVRSHVGAIGPAQVRPEYWSSFCGGGDLTDPEENVYCGAQVLSYFIDRCEGDTVCALSAYNVGPYAKREKAAQRYVNKIDRYLSHLENATL